MTTNRLLSKIKKIQKGDVLRIEAYHGTGAYCRDDRTVMLFLLRFLKLLMDSYSKDGKYFVFEPEHFICHDYTMDGNESIIGQWGYWEHIRPSLSQGLCDIYDQGNYAEISLSGDKIFLAHARECSQKANKTISNTSLYSRPLANESG